MVIVEGEPDRDARLYDAGLTLLVDKFLEVRASDEGEVTLPICTRRAGKLYKAPSRLYRSQMLQVNIRWKALAEIYTMPLHRFWNP